MEFDYLKKTQRKDTATVFKCINIFVEMTVNSCSVTTNGRIKSNLLKCNYGGYFRDQEKTKQTGQSYYHVSNWNLRRL